MEKEEKAVRVLKALNREGYDNSRWGVLDFVAPVPAQVLFGFETGVVVPAGRYVWLWLQREEDFPAELEADLTVSGGFGDRSVAKLYKI